MATYTQSERPLEITTPLGKDVLLLTRFKGEESISSPFHFELDLLASAKAEVKFDKILGLPVTIRMDLTSGDKRYFNGIVTKFSQAGRNAMGFGKFRAEVAPMLWRLTRIVRSRIFQHVSIPEILRQVLVGFDVSYRLIGAYPPRDYCVQYRESDFNFVSRLMEEEGISYFFEHKDEAHSMIVTDRLNLTVQGQSTVTYDEVEGAVAHEMRVTEWEKIQQLRSGEYTFWDHCFELPGNHLEAKKKITEIVIAGTVSHKLRTGGSEEWEVYDYPGAYAQRFDGIDSAGTPQPLNIRHIFEDRSRAIQIRMEQEETAALDIHGESYCGNFSAGHKFTLKRHFDADGEYLLTKVEHEGRLEDYQSGDVPPFTYTNRFHCVPSVVHFRPQPVTRKPVIAGIQTATVVGPPGEEIFVDKYGRVKVQFHWDREGTKDASSSCWLRVSQIWAGRGWGAFFWPRIGHEVIVAFEEGDPDQPIVIGSVYNAENMPWYSLPLCKDFAGVKSSSTRGNAHEHFNGIVLVDRNGQEHMAIHSERHMTFNAEFDKVFHIGRHQSERVPGHKTTTVGGGIPGGSGSGGGPDTDLWPQPPVQSVLGLNTMVVYGANFAAAFPLNFQMALGSNLQLCYNPGGLANLVGGTPMPPATDAVSKVIGSGIGGNMQMTMGTSTNFVIGQSYDINIGPKRIVVDVHGTDTVTKPIIVIAWIMMSLTVVFEAGYALLGADALDSYAKDDSRAILVGAYTVLTQVLLMALMAQQKLDNTVLDTQIHVYRQMYTTGFSQEDPNPAPHASDAYAWTVGVWAIIMGLALAATFIGIGEAQLDHTPDHNKPVDERLDDLEGSNPHPHNPH